MDRSSMEQELIALRKELADVKREAALAKQQANIAQPSIGNSSRNSGGSGSSVDEPLYADSMMGASAPKIRLPQRSCAPSVAFQLIRDELTLDGNPKMNLASFVTTYMEDEAEALMTAAMKKNFIDLDEYPQTVELHNRCVSMLSSLFNAPAPPPGQPHIGTGCVGSSEAIMLCGLAMKWKWRMLRQSRNLPFDRPNVVFGSNVQVCWHKMCKYFDIEMREASVSSDCLVLTADRARPLIDENTIGVCPVLGSTFNGEFENVKEIHDMVQTLNAEHGWDIPIHVDAASGGFVAPFTQPNMEWDFRLPGVKSINVSGHKFGLVYAGIGWAIWRDRSELPDDLVFHVNYLGGDQSSFTLNFSKGAGNVIGQYYNFIRFGFEGYSLLINQSMRTAARLRQNLLSTGKINVVDKADLPLVAFSLQDCTFSVFELMDVLRSRGWIVPAYTCSSGAESFAIMRIVVKPNFSMDMADMLVKDFRRAFELLDDRTTAEEQEESRPVKRVKMPADVVWTQQKQRRRSIEVQRKTEHRHSLLAMSNELEHRRRGDCTRGVC